MLRKINPVTPVHYSKNIVEFFLICNHQNDMSQLVHIAHMVQIVDINELKPGMLQLLFAC